MSSPSGDRERAKRLLKIAEYDRKQVTEPDPDWAKYARDPRSRKKIDAVAENWDYRDPSLDRAPPSVDSEVAEPKPSISEDLAETGWVPSRIVAGALTVMLGLQQLAGAALPFGVSFLWKGAPGQPEDGDYFKEGSHDLAGVAGLLAQAFPVGWTGDAEGAYATLNSVLIDLVSQMVDVDHKLQQLVNDQAECVTRTQLGLVITQDWLLLIYPIVCGLEAYPATLNAAFYLAIGASLAAIITGVGMLIDCVVSAADNAQKANDIHYSGETVRELMKGYLSTSSGLDGSGSTAASSGVGGFVDVLSGPTVAVPGSVTGENWSFGISSTEPAPVTDRAERFASGRVTPWGAWAKSSSERTANHSGAAASRGDGVYRQDQWTAWWEGGGAEGDGAYSGAQRGEWAPIEATVAAVRQATVQG